MRMRKREISWKGWTSLLLFILCFSGILPWLSGKYPSLSWMAYFDFSLMIGRFGTDLVNARESFGAARGFMEAFLLFPPVMLALGLVEIFEYYGALKVAEKIFHPLLKFILGIPGVAGLAFVMSINCSDAAAIMTRELRQEKELTEDERTTFVAYQYPSTSTIINTLGAGGALLPISLLAPGIIIGIQLIVKLIGANLVRLLLYLRGKKGQKAGVR